MRPRTSVEGVILYNFQQNNCWVPLKVEVNSWISLKPGRNGGHAKDAMRHGGPESIEGCYKAKILKFRLRPGSSTVSSVYVQHAYMWRQLELEPHIVVHEAAKNYLYLSTFNDWVDPRSIMGPLVVVHAEVGELTRGSRTHAELLNDGIFFYNAMYVPKSSPAGFGNLIPIPLPDMNSPEWPLPDMSTTESFRAKLRADFHSAMRPTTGSKQTHLSWFLPIHVFIDLFSIAASMYRTPTMYVFKQPTQELTCSLMDNGWDSKITIGAEVIKCTVDHGSMVFRYHIGRSTLYANFVYNRERLRGVNAWEAMDHFEPENTATIHCEMGDTWKQDLEVGMTWSLSNIRKEILIYLGTGLDFQLWIVDNDIATKVNDRNEAKETVANVLPPKKLRLVARI